MSSILELSHVSKKYKAKGKDIQALNKVSLHINEREIVGLVGHNGSGKTTMIKIISGLLVPDGGSVTFMGEAWKEQSAKDHISLLLEGSRSFYWNLTGKQNLSYFAALAGINNKRTRIKELIALLDLSEFINRIVGTYSRGMQQRLSLAIALLTKPKILLLDEPSNGLDYEWSQMLASLLLELREKMDLTVLVVSHDFGFLHHFVERMVFISQGSIEKDMPVKRTADSADQDLMFQFSGTIPLLWELPSEVYYYSEDGLFYVFGSQLNDQLFHFVGSLLEEGYMLNTVTTKGEDHYQKEYV